MESSVTTAIAGLITPSDREGFVLGALTALDQAGLTTEKISAVLMILGIKPHEVIKANERILEEIRKFDKPANEEGEADA